MFCATVVIVTKTVIRAAILRLSIGSEMVPVAHLPDNEYTERKREDVEWNNKTECGNTQFPIFPSLAVAVCGGCGLFQVVAE